jgi:ribonuclease Z
MKTTLTFLGIASAVPEAGEDTASFLVNEELLFDCGWANVLQMRAFGHDPLRVQTLFFTHCHHDHYLGLPAFLFYRAMTSTSPAPLTLVGPADDLSLVVERAMSFLQAERFAPLRQELRLVELEPGMTWQSERYEIQTIRALHPVSGFCGRLLDKQSGVVIAFSGDTAPNPALSQLARGADLLIHEASVPPQKNSHADHSRAADAARTAREAEVHMLRLVHAVAAYRDASLREAQTIFSGAKLASMGETLTWPAQ